MHDRVGAYGVKHSLPRDPTDTAGDDAPCCGELVRRCPILYRFNKLIQLMNSTTERAIDNLKVVVLPMFYLLGLVLFLASIVTLPIIVIMMAIKVIFL